MNFVDKKISVKPAVALLAKNGIQVDDNEAALILNFLYLIAKTYNQYDSNLSADILKGKSNYQKVVLLYHIREEHQVVLADLKDEWAKITVKLNCIDKQLIKVDKTFLKIFAGFEDLDINDKKLIIDRIPPSTINTNGAITLEASTALSKILAFRK
jgi:hypothetical protein